MTIYEKKAGKVAARMKIHWKYVTQLRLNHFCGQNHYVSYSYIRPDVNKQCEHNDKQSLRLIK